MRRVLLCICCVLVVAGIAIGEDCGSPGRPVNGSSSVFGGVHLPGTVSRFECRTGFVLFGQSQRSCQSNGTWSGELPKCDFNLARGKSTLQSTTLWSYKSELAVDGNPASCSFTQRSAEQRWWQVHLGHRFNVVSVGITISAKSYQEFTIFVIDLLSDNKALYRPCTTFHGSFQSDRRLFRCNDGLGHPGQFVYIRDDRDQQEYFGLCEVEVFAQREHSPCGDPERPAYGTVTEVTRGQVRYDCQVGYRLEGSSLRNCSQEGRWTGQQPYCKMSMCHPPVAIEHGVVEVNNYNGGYLVGTVASYRCNPGYIVWGNSSRVCREDGSWSNEEPECKAITCGHPPLYRNSHVSLTNETTLWKSVASYNCDAGYNMEDSSTRTSMCDDSGAWTPVNFTCRPRPSPVPTQLEDVVPEPVMGTGAVVAVSVVAGMLVGLMIVTIILVTCRKLRFNKNKQPVSNMSSTNHLVGPLDDRSPVSPFGDPKFTFSSVYPSDSVFPPTRLYPPTSPPPPTPPSERLYPMESYLHALNTSRSGSIEPEQEEEDPNYEKVSASEDQEPPYEKIKNDPEYATIKRKKSLKDPDYETIKRKQSWKSSDPNYETIKPLRTSNDGGNVMSHVKRLSSSSSVPDILQNVRDSDGPPSLSSDGDVPPEILALYAKIDKSKKRKNCGQHSVSVDDLHTCPDVGDSVECQVVSDLNKINQESVDTAIDDIIYASLNHSLKKSHQLKQPNNDGVVYSTILRPLPPLPADSTYNSMSDGGSDVSDYEIPDSGTKTRT